MPANRSAFCQNRTRFLLTTLEARRFCGFLRQRQEQGGLSIRQLALSFKGKISRAGLQDWLGSASPVVRRSTASRLTKLAGVELVEVIQPSRDRTRLSGLDDVLQRAAVYNRPSADLVFRAMHEIFLYLREWGVSVSLTAQTRAEGDEVNLRVPLGGSNSQAQITLEAHTNGFYYAVQIVKGAARTPTMDGALTLESARKLRLHLRELDRRELRADNLRFQVDRKSTNFSNNAHRH